MDAFAPVKNSHKPRLLMIIPGPLWEIKTSLRKRAEGLSRDYRGAIVTAMPVAGEVPLGGFTLMALRFRRFKPWMNLKFMAYGCRLALCARFLGRRQGRGWDLVVTYDPLRSGLIGLLIARLSGARFCPEVNGVYDSYANYLDDPPGIMLWIKRRLYPRLIAFTLTRADGIKTLFPGQLDRFCRVLKTPIIEPFFDYVDLEPFRDLGEEKVVLFVGYPFRLKGVDILIDAFKRVSPSHPDWTLKILGWYPDDRELRAAMAGHPRILHHPPVYSHEMPEHMGRCGIFVLPSRSEAMGRVLLEAMASGKPRIGSNLEGIPTVINDGVDGLLFRPGDADDLAKKLERLMGDPGLRKSLGEAGRLRASREFGSEEYLSRLAGFYGRVLEAERKPAVAAGHRVEGAYGPAA